MTLVRVRARRIQSYILSSRLREIEGASELVRRLTEEGDDSFLVSALRNLFPEGGFEIVTAAAGRAHIAFDHKADARTFLAAWPLLADSFAPGIAMHVALDEAGVSDAETSDDLPRPRLPEVPAIAEIRPESGLPATPRRLSPAFGYEDEVSYRKALAVRDRERRARGSSWDERLCALDPLKGRDLEEGDPCLARTVDGIVTADGSARGVNAVAIIHADGNALGAVLANLRVRSGDRFRALFRTFSDAISAATSLAVAEALAAIAPAGKEKIPARPVVLGGDDVTLVVRADLAFAWVESFLAAFETESAKALAGIASTTPELGLPEKLTACAGIAIVHASFPFAAAYGLAESLCADSKRAIKAGNEDAKWSGYLFRRVTESVIAPPAVMGDAASPVFGPWLVTNERAESPPLPRASDLRAMASALAQLPSGPVRRLVALLESDLEAAKEHYDRFKEVASERYSAVWARFTKHLALTNCKSYPWCEREGRRVSPMRDAHTFATMDSALRDIRGRQRAEAPEVAP